MDINDDSVSDPTAAFGDLFENDLTDHDPSDVLSSLGHDIELGSSTHPSEHDILAANLNFVTTDGYLQQQHVVLDNDNQGYNIVPVTDVAGIESQNQGMPLQDGSHQQVYTLQQALEHSGIVGGNETVQYNFSEASAPETITSQQQQQETQQVSIPVPQEPKMKQKAKVVKSVEYFTNENMEKYLARRGFKTKKGGKIETKSISKGVLALQAKTEMSKCNLRLVSFRSKYEPEYIIGEMERFWKFYLTTKRSPNSTSFSTELSPMLIPMLLHFYFEMMLAHLFPIARRICVEFSKKFFHEDKTQEQYDILCAMMKITSVDSLKTDSILSKLLKKKFEFFLSEPTITLLRRFLSKSTHPILPNLFTCRFIIRSKESKELFDTLDWEGMLDPNGDTGSSDDEAIGAPKDGTIFSDYTEEVISAVRNSVSANLPFISVYTFGENPVCGAISKKGSMIAFGLSEAGIRICPVDSSRDVAKLHSCDYSHLLDPEVSGLKTIGGHAGTVYGVNFHPKTKLLFSVGQDSMMRAWDLNQDNPKCRAVYRGHTGPIWNLDIPGSGSLIATAGLDTTARIFLPEKNECVRIMAGHYFSVNTVKFHPNEAYIATGSSDKSVRLWSVNTGNIVRMYTGPAGTVSCVAFHESGKYLAGAGEDKKILVWDLAEGEVVATLDSEANCKDLSFSGNMLAACFRNGMVQIFNLRPVVGGQNNGISSASTRSSVLSPFTTKCFAKTLFKVHYKDPGRLYCLGSDLIVDEFDFKSQQEQLKSQLQQQPTPPVRLAVTDEAHVNNNFPDTVNLEDPKSNSSSVTRKVLKSRISTASSDADESGQDGSSIISAGRILATRLSQPLSVSSSSGDEAMKDACLSLQDNASTITLASGLVQPGPATPAAAASASAGRPLHATQSSSTSMITSSELDAAIASVIDQSGGDNSTDSGGGTITMYASS